MAKYYEGDTPMVTAKNPWHGTEFGKSKDYKKRTVPWDKRRRGVSAMSDRQMRNAQTFGSIARESGRDGRIYEECVREGNAPGSMPMNECRIRKIKQQMTRRAGPTMGPDTGDRRPMPRGYGTAAPMYRNPRSRKPRVRVRR